MNASYQVARIDHESKIVRIIDLDEPGRKSVTNDAEGVCERVNRDWPTYRIIYRDTMGNWDELVHENGTFKAFKPARVID